ncbi:MAG: hypothetical protein WBF88_04355 [Pusillimonas sp.]
MFIIYAHGANRGVGMGYEEFRQEFARVCEKHLQSGRARSFGFIFYNMADGFILNALHQPQGFEILNEASGQEMTLFHLHSEAAHSYANDFNNKFLNILNVIGQASPPCIVFFRVYKGNAEDVDIRNLDSETEEPHYIVEELRRYIAEYNDRVNSEGDLSGITVPAKYAMIALLKRMMG